MLDFGAFPPEFNSARIYSGPGSGSLLAAASAWSALAAELNSAALSYENVVTALSSEEWTGTASATMAQAAAPYAAWMTATAAQAEEAATQARLAAAAYETALASSVPPPLIAANRMQTTQLQATNVLGQNTPLIAQLEAQYAQMWAQDAAAMYSYAGQSSTATKLTPLQKAPEVTNQAAPLTQGAAVNNAAANSTATNTSKVLSSLAQPATTAPQAATTGPPTSAYNPIWYLLTGQTTSPTNLAAMVNGYAPYAGLFYNTEGLPYFSIGMGNNFVQIAKSLGAIGAPAAAAPKALPGLGGLGGMLGGGAAGGAAHPVAALGGAGSVGGGKLSVPVSWSGAQSAAPVLGRAIPVSSVSAAPEAVGGPGNLLGGMPLAGAGTGGHGVAGPKYGFRPTVMARPPFAG